MNPQKINDPNTALRRNFQDGLVIAIYILYQVYLLG
jgi:hypothetical protein